MAQYSKGEFAQKCGMASNKLSVYIKRGKVLMTGDMIDDTVPQNQAFLIKESSRIGNMQVLATESTEKPKKESVKKEVPEEVNKSFALDLEKKQLENEKAALSRDLLVAKIGKQRAELIPYDLVKMALGQHFKDLTVAMGHGIQNLLVDVASRAKLNAVQKAELRSSMERVVNDSIQRAVDATTKQLKLIGKEHSEKLERGEKAA